MSCGSFCRSPSMVTTTGARAWSELRERDELAVAPLDVVAGERPEPATAEVLDDVGGEHAAVDDGAAESRFRAVPGARQVAHEAAGERVAGAGRVEDLLQRVGW